MRQASLMWLRATGRLAVAGLVGVCLMGVAPAFAQDSVPAVMNGLAAGLPALVANDAADGSTSYSLSLQILALMTALTVLPSLVLGMTSFTRIIIVLSLSSGHGHSANPSQSGFDCYCAVSDLLHYVANPDVCL